MKSVKDKLIITAAVGFTAASTMVNSHFTNVLADEVKDPAFVKEDVSKNKTEKEKLEDSVKVAKSNLDEKKAEVEAKKEAVDASKEIVDDLTEQKANQQAALDSKLNYEEELYNNLAQKINDLNKEIANKQAELKEQEAKHEAAKKTLDNAKHDLEDKEQTRDELKAELDKYDEKTLKDNLDKASQAVDQANKDYEATEQLKNDTLSKLETVNKNVEAKKTELENSKVAHQNAINDVAAKQAAVDKAQTDVDSFNQSDALDTAKSDLAKAQTDLETAKANAKTAGDALTNAEIDYNNALKEQTSKQKDYDASVTELDNATKALENANEAKTNAQQAYDKAKTLVDEKANLIKDYENAYTIAQQQVASAEKRVEQAQKDYDSGKTEKEIAQEKLDEFEKTNKELIDLFKNREGTKMFFQYLKADSAVELLSNPGSVLKDYTTLGDASDATNTNYLNYVFDYIDECNKIRKDLGLNELKVSAYLMADAELNANYLEYSGIDEFENIRLRLRDLIKYIPRQGLSYETNFEDDILDVQFNDSELENDDLKNYKSKIEYYIRQHQKDNPVILKIKENKPLSSTDLVSLENILWKELGSKKDYYSEVGEKPICEFVREIVGLDMNAAKDAFSKYLDERNLNSEQIYFVNQIIEYIVRNGLMKDMSVLQQSPFTDKGSVADLFGNDIQTWMEIKSVIDNINNNANYN